MVRVPSVAHHPARASAAKNGHLPKKNKPTTTQAIATYATNEPQYATRSLLSRSRVDWAIEAARRVGAEQVGALGEAGLRGRVGRCSYLRMPAASARRAAKVIAERKIPKDSLRRG